MIESIGDGEATKVFLTRERLKRMPSGIKALVAECSEIVENDQDTTIFGDGSEMVTLRIVDCEAAQKFLQAAREWDRNTNRSERRREAEYTKSGGVYTPEDIAAIFEIQNGRCYFTNASLEWSPRNWSVDHLAPVAKGGTSWPGNIALVLKNVNLEKHTRTKAQFWELLRRTRGEQWVRERREACKEIDRRRMRIHRARKKQVDHQVSMLVSVLNVQFPDAKPQLEIYDNVVILGAAGVTVKFPPGILRKRQAMTLAYMASVVAVIVQA